MASRSTLFEMTTDNDSATASTTASNIAAELAATRVGIEWRPAPEERGSQPERAGNAQPVAQRRSVGAQRGFRERERGDAGPQPELAALARSPAHRRDREQRDTGDPQPDQRRAVRVVDDERAVQERGGAETTETGRPHFLSRGHSAPRRRRQHVNAIERSPGGRGVVPVAFARAVTANPETFPD